MSEINVISRTQKIIVEPFSRSVNVINLGPMGPGGPPGAPGDPGEPGGTLLSAFWQYSSTSGLPPGSGQMRSNTPLTELYIHEIDTDGYDRHVGLGMVSSAAQILVRATNGTSMDLQIEGPPVDNGTYWTFPVSILTGLATKGSRTQLNFVFESVGGVPPGGLTGQVLTKQSDVSGEVDWETLGSAGAPVSFRQVSRDEAGATYSPVASDENQLIKLTNSGAITVSLPSNATTAIPVDTAIDFVWWGVGQPTFAAGSGASADGTPGLKLRARYSGATAKKLGTNAWWVYGDLSA